MKQSQQSFNLQGLHLSRNQYYTISRPKLSLTLLHFIISLSTFPLAACFLTILKLFNFHLHYTLTYWLSHKIITYPLPPTAISKLHILSITCSSASTLNRSSKYSLQVFHTLSSLTTSLLVPAFILLQLSSFPTFAITTLFHSSFLFPLTF